MRFERDVPNYTTNVTDHAWPNSSNFRIDLFDWHKNVGITLINSENANVNFAPDVNQLAHEVRRDFERQNLDVDIGVFYQTGETISRDTNQERPHWWIDGEWGEWQPIPTDEAEAAAIQAENLRQQVQNFIQFLKDEGVI